MAPSTRALIEKIQTLPSEQFSAVEEFVDFIVGRAQDQALSRAASEASISCFSKVWNNPEDDVYDVL